MKICLLVCLIFAVFVLCFSVNFVSAASAPGVTTNSTTDQSGTNITLNGFLSDYGGANCTVWFQYGETDSYGDSTSSISKNVVRIEYISAIDDAGAGSPYKGVWGDGTYIYSAVGSKGIYAYSFNGTNFTLLDYSDDGDYYESVWGDGTYIYVASSIEGIRAYSFNENGTEEFWLKDVQVDGYYPIYDDVWGNESYIYVSAEHIGIMAYTFNENGTEEFWLKDVQFDGDVGQPYNGVWCNDSIIYVTVANSGIMAYTFNENGTEEFWLKDVQDDGGYYEEIFSDGMYVYSAVSSDGVYAYSFNGTNFTLEGQRDDGSYYKSVFSDGMYVYTGIVASSSSPSLRTYKYNGTDFSIEYNHTLGTYSDGKDVWGDGIEFLYVASYGKGVRAYRIHYDDFFSSDLTGLSSGTTYHYRSVAQNSYGTVYGSDMNFSIPGSVTNVSVSVPGNVVFSWDKGLCTENTVIVVNGSMDPVDVSDGVVIYNDSGSSFIWSNISANTTYYFGIFGYNNSMNYHTLPVCRNVTTLADVVAPSIVVSISVDSGFNVDSALINVSVNDNYAGNVAVNISANGEYFNESVSVPGYITEVSFNLSGDGINVVYVNATDSAGNNVSYSESMTFYYVNCSLINERDGTLFDWTNAKNNGNLSGCLLTIPGKNVTLDLYVNENTSFTYVSSDEDIIRINMSFDNTVGSVIRSFDMSLLDPVSRIGLVETEQSFYAQFIYSATVKPVIVKNVLSNCFVHAGYTYEAYEDYYSTQVVTIDMLYYLYTFSSGNKVLLSSIEGSRASTINLEFLTYQNLSYSFSMLSEDVHVSKTTNTTLKIYYANIAGDNAQVEIKLYDGDDLVFQHVETEDPNEITLYFDYSTITLNNEMLLLSLELTRDDDSVDTIEKYISTSGKVGLIDAGLAVMLAIMFCVFGFTFASSKVTFGYFGIIIEVIGLGITVLAAQVWYITFIQVIIGILLVITIFIYKKENAMIT